MSIAELPPPPLMAPIPSYVRPVPAPSMVIVCEAEPLPAPAFAAPEMRGQEGGPASVVWPPELLALSPPLSDPPL
jgi:hypothetical protein